MVERARGYGARSSPAARRPRGDLAARLPTTSRPSSPTWPLDSEIWRDEVFGPVLVVVPFDDDDEAIAPGQRHPVRPRRLGLDARHLPRPAAPPARSAPGCVWVNDHIPIISEMPHGGYKHSGFGKDMSAYSFDEYTNVKHVMHDNTAVAHKPWHRTIFTLPG